MASYKLLTPLKLYNLLHINKAVDMRTVCVSQVVTLRIVHEKLLRLLPGGKQQAVTAERVFEPFSGLNPLHYNPYTEVSGRSQGVVRETSE